ncbi:MAG: flippase-like domain-containing protein [Flavobacteriaceae bacterium]|nr:flippase-like domain-containing protein [Bacteroidia bacterium]NNK82526.1 flippase-like domain-containing protein [Flavobacteriaceae bacterium]
MKPKTKRVIKIGIPLLLAVFFGWYTFTKLPVEEFIPYFKNANYYWILLGVFCGILSHLSRAYRWKFMLEPLGFKPHLPNSIMAVFIAYFTNFGIPRSGEVLRAAVFANYEDVPFEKGFGTIVAERIADMIVMLGIITITLFLEFDFIVKFFLMKFNPKTLVLAVLILLVLSILFLVFIKRSQSVIAVKIKNFIKGLIEGILSIFKMKKKWAFIFHTLFIWAMYLLMFYFTSFAVKELIGIPFAAILIGFIAASFTIAATNGGIFVYPLAIGAAFSLFSIPETPSIAFGWIVWTSQTLLIIAIGSLSFLLLPVYNRNK